MIYLCLLSGYIMINSVQQTLQVTAYCSKIGQTNDGLEQVMCTKPNYEIHSVLPNNIPYDVEVLHLSELVNLEMDVNTFSQFIDLKKVIIERTYFVDKNWIKNSKPQEWFDSMHKNLFADTNIVEILLKECHLKDENVFTFPTVIRALDLTDNKYTVIDLRGYEDLEDVNVELNLLESLPQFTDPAPSIRYLNLKKNTLNNITVDHIASLCSLRKLEMQFIEDDAFLKTLKGKCECERIGNWSKEVNFTLIGLECFDANESVDCSSYTLDEARKKRQRCMNSIKGFPFLYRFVRRHFYKILSVALGLFIFAIAVYTVYKIHREMRSEEIQSKGKPSKATTSATTKATTKATSAAAEESEREPEDHK